MKKAYLLATLSGCTWALSGAPFNLPPVGWLGVPMLMAAIELAVKEGKGLRTTFALGLLSGFACNAIALGWVIGLLRVFGHFPLVGALPTGALLWLAQGLPFAFAALATHALLRFDMPAWISLPITVTIATVITPALFPWHIAATQLPFTAFVQLAEVGGTPLVDLFLALFGCAAWEAVRTRSWRIALVAAAAFAIPTVYGLVRLPMVRATRMQGAVTRVGVVQPNVGIEEKHDPVLAWSQLDLLRRMTRELEAARADITVWPETAYPFAVDHNAQWDIPSPNGLLREGVHGPLLFGSISTEGDAIYNSAVAMQRDGRIVGISDKVQLLAFGEYVPLWDVLPPLRTYFPRRGITPGDAPRVLQLAHARIGVLNCYEDVLDTYGRRVAQEHPDFLVNVTNDAWFGDTSEPYLHQAVARFRAIETRRDLVRAVNTGVSSHISATGEEIHATPTWQPQTFIAEVRAMNTVTPWTRVGDWTTPLLAFGTAAWMGWVVRRRRSQRKTATLRSTKSKKR